MSSTLESEALVFLVNKNHNTSYCLHICELVFVLNDVFNRFAPSILAVWRVVAGVFGWFGGWRMISLGLKFQKQLDAKDEQMESVWWQS